MTATRALSRGLLSGAGLGVSSLPGPAGPVAFVALVPLLAAIDRGIGVRRAAAAGYLTGVVFFGVGFGFVPSSSAKDGMALTVAYGVGLALLAIGPCAFAAALAALHRISPALALAASPSLWIFCEYARSAEWWFSIPWLHLGYALAEEPGLIQSAHVIGLYGVSFWVVAVNAALVGARRMGRSSLLLLPALLAPALPGLWLGGEPPAGTGESLRIAAVQPATSEAERDDPDRHGSILRRLLELTDVAAASEPDLVVWPESAYPRPLGERGDPFLSAIANDLGTPLLTGARRASRASAQGLRNAAFLLRGDGSWTTAAEKVHPVTVYERAPEGAISRALARLGLWTGRFARGDPAPPVLVDRGDGSHVAVGVLVCIDASYPAQARRLRAMGARLLIQVSNEAGTGGWSARLHSRIVRFRAVETRTPLVRVANTGPTQWIDARGRVRHATRLDGPTVASHALAPAGPPPPSVHLGEASAVTAALGPVFLALGWQCRPRRRRHAPAGPTPNVTREVPT